MPIDPLVIVSTRSIDELLEAERDLPIRAGEVAAIRDALWQTYLDEVRADPVRIAEHAQVSYTYATTSGNRTSTVRAIPYNGRTMRYTTAMTGPQTDRALVITLHGGGGTADSVNNGDWAVHQTLWAGDNPGIYAAVRGITNNWNLHFDGNSYPMYDRLIENLIAFDNVDPNRVYLMGFSAGGDGVYQISPRMADRFAATNMMAGHPNGAPKDNLRNLPFLIQMGENDTAFNRHTQAAQYHVGLDALAAGGDYVHETFMHPGGSHNNWIGRTQASAPATAVIADLQRWLDVNDRTTRQADTGSIPWLTNHIREPNPDRVTFQTRAGTRSGVDSQGKRWWRGLHRAQQLYWVDMGGNSALHGRIDVSTDRAANRLEIHECGGHLRVLLSDEIFNLRRTIEVLAGGDRFRFRPILGLKTMARTLIDRGDPAFCYAGDVFLRQEAGEFRLVGAAGGRLEDMVGGSGRPFEHHPPATALVDRIQVHASQVVQSIGFLYDDGSARVHGGSSAPLDELILDPDEVVTRIWGHVGTYQGDDHIADISFETNNGRTLGPIGGGAGSNLTAFEFAARSNEAIISLAGRTRVGPGGRVYLTAISPVFRTLATPMVETATGTVGAISSGTSRFTAVVASTGPLRAATVSVDLQHPNAADLTLELVSPQGTRVLLSDRSGSGADVDVTFDDQGSTPSGPLRGTITPDGPLSALLGESPSGTWMLRMQGTTTAALQGWSIEVHTHG